jgi:GT2 family glycosyltransferase
MQRKGQDDMHSEPLVSVVLLNWNGWADTCECIRSLSEQEHPNFNIIVVDNCSSDGSAEKIKAFLSAEKFLNRSTNCEIAVNFIQSADNGGFAKGNNIGIRQALDLGAEYVWILNNDTVVDRRALACAQAELMRNPRNGLCGSVLIYYDDRHKIQAVGGVCFSIAKALGYQLGEGLDPSSADLHEIARSNPITYIAGAAMLAPAKMLAEVGLMYEDYFLYYEEIDWCDQIRERGWRICVAADSLVYHKEGASIGTATRKRRSKMSQYYLSRNLLGYYLRRHPGLFPVAVARVMKNLFSLAMEGDRELALVSLKALLHGFSGRKGKVVL